MSDVTRLITWITRDGLHIVSVVNALVRESMHSPAGIAKSTYAMSLRPLRWMILAVFAFRNHSMTSVGSIRHATSRAVDLGRL
jgi:hypothetical protein